MATIDTLRFDLDSSDELMKLKHYGKSIGENWPVVYILNNDEKAYIGETHHTAVRINQHLGNPEKKHLTEIRIISADNFNKSVILDLESFLISHMSADGKYELLNRNNGLQNHDYYNRSKYAEGFRKIWNQLKNHGIVKNTISEIENSTLFKYSPYKSLGVDQVEVEHEILRLLSRSAG